MAITQKWYVYAIQDVCCDFEGKHYDHLKVFYCVQRDDNSRYVSGMVPSKYPQKVEKSVLPDYRSLTLPCELTALFEPDGRYNKFAGFKDSNDIFEGTDFE